MVSNPDFHIPFRDKHRTLTPSDRLDRRFSKSNDVPSNPPQLTQQRSHTSVFSDMTDPSHMSSEPDLMLRRTISNVSNISTHSNVGPLTLRQRLQNLYDQNYGALLVLTSQLFGTGMNTTARILEQPGVHGSPMHPFQILFVRQLLTAVLCTAYAVMTKSIPHFPLGPPDRKVRLLLLSRGIMGFFGVCGMYFSLIYLPLSEATVLTFLAPILTCSLCSMLLPGETFSRQQQIAGFVSLIGVIFIAQPATFFSSPSPPSSPGVDGNLPPTGTIDPSEPLRDHDPSHPTPSQHLLAIGIAMIGVLGSTCAMTSIRAIGTRAHAFISIYYFSVWSAMVSLIALLLLPEVSFRLPGNLVEWALLISLGIFGFVMQSLLTMGLAYGGPADTHEPKLDVVSIPSQANNIQIGSKLITRDIEMQDHPVTSTESSSSNRDRSNLRARSQTSRAKPSGNRATSMVYCQMLFALAADKVIFGTTLGIWSWIGSGLILFGAVWVATAKDGIKERQSQAAGSTRLRSVLDGNEFVGASSSRTEASLNVTGRPGASEEQIGLLRDGDFDNEDEDEDEGGDKPRQSSPISSLTSTSSLASSRSVSPKTITLIKT